MNRPVMFRGAKHPGNPHGYPDYTWPMVWVLQDGELWPIEQWAAHQGVQKSWYLEFAVNAGALGSVSIYTVPTGKKLYLIHDIFSGTQLGMHALYYLPADVVMYALDVLADTPFLTRAAPPFVLAGGQTLWAQFRNRGGAIATIRHAILAYELDA